MLRHSLATLEGCNLLWHIVAPSYILSLFLPVWIKLLLASTSEVRDGNKVIYSLGVNPLIHHS